MLLISDLHLKSESADVVFEALDRALQICVSAGHRALAVLGDTYHFRYAVPVVEQNRLDRWCEAAVARGVELHFLAGNHDSVDVNGQNALEVLARPHVHVYTEPTENEHGLWLPYRVDKNVYEAPIAKSKAKRAFVHHGLIGAEMNNGIRAGEKDGVPLEMFARFETVFFGHWHRHQQIGNCVYVGSPWQTKADEAGQQKVLIELDDLSGNWRAVPIDIGRRFHAYNDSDARPGDVIKLAHGTQPDTIQGLLARGFEVRMEAPPPPKTTVRLGTGASMRDKAVKYVAATAPEILDRAFLMQLFDEVVAL